MRVLLLALVAALALAGVAAAAPGGSSGGGRGILSGFRAGRKSRGLLQLDQPGGIDVTSLASGASTISLTVQQRKDPNAQVSLKYYLVSYNNNTKVWPAGATEVPSSRVTTTTQADTPSADFNTYQVTLTGVAAGYYRVRVAVVRGTDEFPRTFPATDGVAVGTPGDVAINGAAPVTGDRLQVTFTIGSPVTAGKYRYQVYQFGSTRNPAQASAFVDITPWTTATHTFTTPTATPLSSGLYSVWVEVQHKDDATLSKTTTTGATTSYAIGTPGKPSIARVDEPSSVSQKFTVYFVLPNNVQEMGYTLTNLKDNSDATPTATCQLIGGSKCKAAFTPVTNGPNGATHSLETDSAPANALYQIKLWAFNDVDRSSGMASDPSKPVATYDTPGAPDKPAASETSANSKVLRVTFSRAATAIASSYRYDVVDAAGAFAKNGNDDMQNLVADIADVNQLNLQFDTLAITSVNKRYKVVLRACTRKDCSAGTDSNLAAVGPPTAPRSVEIASAGVDKLTVTWAAPTTDTATSYTVRLYRSADAFAGSHVAEWAGISWILQPGQTAYSYTTPKLDAAPYSLSLGYYKAEVLAVSQLYPANPPKEDSNSDEAALGIPGPITVKTVVQEPLANQVRITFSEAQPKTAEWYALTVQKWNQVTSSWESQPGLIKVARSATARGDGDKDIIQSTTASEWTGAGKYQFIVSAGNEAGGANEYPRDSAPAQLLVGPPGRPTATAPDTTGTQLNITIAQGTPTLDEDYQVRIFKFAANAWPLTCPTAGWIEETDPSKALTATTSTLTDAKAIYCIRAVALFGENGEIYGQSTAPSPIYVGTPDNPNTPTLTNGKTSLSVSFNCPTGVWNSRFMTYELKRVDMGRSDVVVNGDKATSPKLVRGTASTGEIGINENAGVCSFSIPSTGTNSVPNAADASSNVGKYKIRLKAHNNAASSLFSVESGEAALGEPEPPTGVRVTNSATTDTKVTIEMGNPGADVHGGFVLQLKWRRSGKPDVDVTSATAADLENLYISRDDANVNAPNTGPWTISFPISGMRCDGSSCNDKGRFKVVAFSALSRFDTNGNPVGTGANDYKQGKQVPAADADVPQNDIFYGNPGQPTGLAFLNQPVRIYGPSATNTLDLQFDVPDADVAAEYHYELYYFRSQGDTRDAVLVTDKAAWSDLDTATTDKFTLKIDLTKLDCNTAQAGVQGCTSGSYQLKSFKALTRVPKATGGQDSSDATLPSPNNIIIVAATGSGPEAAKNVHVPDVQLAGTPANTQVYIEVDLPTTDNIMGWVYNLQYIPYGDPAQAVAVTASGSQNIYTQRYCASGCATRDGSRLQIPLPTLGQLTCTNFATCSSAGGRFKLTALQALSWFSTSNAAVQWDAAGRAAAMQSGGLTATSYKTGNFGSPRTANSRWNANYHVGSPAAPTGIRVPDVRLATNNVQIYLAAPVDDLAYAYTFTINRIQADGTADADKTVTVYQDERVLQQSEFVLPIGTDSLDGPGRYQLTAAAAKSWFNTDVSAALVAPIHFIYGSPSEADAPVISAVPNEQTGTTLHVAINPPVADVARYYTVAVDYYSGKAASRSLLTTQTAVVDFAASCSTTGKEALSSLQRTAQKGASLVVRCPTSACAGDSAAVYKDGAYLFTSSICRAAVHAGVITDGTGDAVTLTLSQGAGLPRSFAAAPAQTAGANGVALEALAGFNTAADNWDMALAAATGLPTTTTFTIMRWGGTARDASLTGNKLVLPIDLTQGTNCGQGGVQCGTGKYLVKSVTAHPWSGSGSKPSTPDRTAFTFVGEPETPTNVQGVDAASSGSAVTLRFDRPEFDTAQKYIFVLTKYFPGDDAVTQTCTGEFPMPDATTATEVPGVDPTDTTKRTITVDFANLTPSTTGQGVTNACASLRGKFRVTSLTATSRHTGGTPGTFTQADNTPASYFYLGALGAITQVTPSNQATSPAATLTVNWRPSSADAHPAQSASYSLWRYRTGDTDANRVDVCTGANSMTIDATQMDGVAVQGDDLQLTNLPFCNRVGETTLASGRYKINWVVQGWTATGAQPTDNQQSKLSEFFYVGTPTAPGTPTLTNEISPTKQLKAVFTIPGNANDNAEKYTYDVVRVDTPSVAVPQSATASATGYTFLSAHTNKDVVVDATTFDGTTRTIALSITGLDDALYRVRVNSVNPNSQDPARSQWSAPIGTGNPVAPVITSDVVDNVASGTTLNVKLDKPNLDVALYYTVEVEYYSGQRTDGTRLTTTGTAADVADVAGCGVTGKAALSAAGVTLAAGASLVVSCPKNCAGQAGDVYNDGTYLFTSSICRAAVHAGVIVSGDGGIVSLTLSAGDNLPRTFTDASTENLVQTAALNFDTAADNWNMAIVAVGSLPTTDTFTVMRWGGTNRVAYTDPADATKLVLPIDLSKSSKCGATQTSQCGNGKYVVKQVKAFPWVNGGSFVSTGTGVPLANDRTAFTFVGNPGNPASVAGVSAAASGPSVQVQFALPEQDNAKGYTVVITKYFPGRNGAGTCTGTFTMPDSAPGTKTGLSDDPTGSTRTITFGSLTPTASCSLLSGKFQVTSLTATSRHSAADGGIDGTFTDAAFATARLFYIDSVGDITQVTATNQTGSPATSLTVRWRQDKAQPAKSARYSLYRYLTGQTDTNRDSVCAGANSVDITADELNAQTNGVTEVGSDLQFTTSKFCTGVANLQSGRYLIDWTVQGDPTTNTKTNARANTFFFYIGNPDAPGKPALTNDVANTRLKVTFTTPTADNAEKFTYDLVKLSNPSVMPVGDVSNPQAGFDFPTGHQDQDLPSLNRILGAANGANPTLNTFYITGLTDGLYRVRVRSNNPNGADALSAWSEPIGTGDISSKKPSSVTVTDGETTLTVTFKLVAGATGYRYTVYTEDSGSQVLMGHQNIEVAAPAITTVDWKGSTEATFDIAARTGATLPSGRYTVAIAAKNTDGSGNPTWGDYERAASRAAVGKPSAPTGVTLANTLVSGAPKVGSVTVTFSAPIPDSGLEYWYALYKADTDEQCYTALGTKEDTSDTLLTATTKSFELTGLASGDYQVRVGVKNGLTTGSTAGTAKLCTNKATTTQLSTDVAWSALSTEIIAVDNPGKPGTPSVVYNHNGNQLTVTFSAPNMTRTYTYQVTKSDGSIHVPVGTPVDFAAANPTKPDTFTISTSGWGPDRYQVTVYVQNAFTTGNGDASDASTGVYIGTPGQVSAVKLENKAGAGDTITVKYTPPTGLDIAGEADSTGSYRYTVQKREVGGSNNYVFADLTGKVDQDVGKPGCSGATKVCSFDISGLTAGMYQVKVWGRMTYPKTGGGDDVATGTPISSSGDHSTFMRSGQVAVGAPGVPAVALTGAADRMTITISSVNGNENALSYQWVFLKDADTARTDVDTTGLPGIDIPVSGTGSVDPLAAPLSEAPITYTVGLDSTYTAGTYRVGVIAVNGAGTSNYQLTTVNRATSIMGPPSTPVVSSFVVKDNTMDELVVTWNMPNLWTANPSATPSYTYTITNVLSGSTDTYTNNLNVPSASGTDQTFTQKVTPTISGSGLYKVVVTARNTNGASSNTAFPSTGLVVGVPIAGSPDGLRDVSASRKVDALNPNTETLSIDFKDNLNSWAGSAGSCETFYEWEVVRWPGLELAASSSQPVHPCGDAQCSIANRACNGIEAGVSSLTDGRYQVFILAYNKYGYTRSEGSNVFTVGAPSSNLLSITARDGDGKITVSFTTPDWPGSYQCQGTGADGTVWTPATVTKQLSQVSLSSDGKTTSFDITSTDVPALASTKQRWAVQCRPINDWTDAVGYSALAYAASGVPVAVGAPTLALAGSTVTFTFAPATPDAAITYVFILEDQNGTVYESPAVGFASLAAGAGPGNKAYTWANAPSGQFKGKVRSINGVGSATSPESAADLVVGRPGTPGTPTALSGQTGFVVSFSPGSPSAATAFYYTIYPVGSETPVTGGEKLLADPATATGATVPATPSGSTDYRGLTPFDRLQFNTGNLALKSGLTLAAGVYQIAVMACNDKLPAGSQCSDASAKSTVVSRGSPGIPTGLATSTGSQGGLKVEFNVPSPDAASFYEYTVRDAANNVSVTGATRVRVERPSPSNGKLSFNTVPLSDYKSYQLRLTAVGAGSVFSSWSSSAVAGMLGKPTAVSVAPGADKLTVTFTAGALLLDTDTFAYKLYALGATPVAVGDANGYLVPRDSITGTLSAAGAKSFDIALDTGSSPNYGVLLAPAGGFYVEVMAARTLAGGGFEAGAVSSQTEPAALGAPSALAAAPTVTAVTSDGSPKATIQWDYADTYSTYTKVDWQIKKVDGTTVVASGSVNRAGDITAAVSSPLSIDIPLNTGGESKNQLLAGRFTVELRMANDQASSAWSAASAIFAAGNPTAPATVTIAGGTSSMTGTFTLPPTPVYDTLSYRLVSVGEDGTGTTLLFGGGSWKELTSAEISAGTFTIPGTVVVGGTSYAVPTGRYRLDMRAATSNGANPADYLGSTANQTPAYKGTPAAVTAVTATSGATSIQISFNGAAFATGYKVHVLDSNGAAVQSGGTDVISTLNGISGSGSHSYSLQLVELGSPSGAATFRFKVESLNPNTAGTGALSSATSTPVIFGKLAKPATPVLEWFAAAASAPAYMELRFQAVTAPAGAQPAVYEYQLVNATSGTVIGGWQAIDMSQTTGTGFSADPFKLRLFPSPGRYTAKVRAGTALSATATSDESSASQPEVMGLTSQPSIAAIGSGPSTIVTADDGATTVKLLVTLPSNNLNSGDSTPQLQLRMDTVERTAAVGNWTDVGASCPGATAFCAESGAGTSTDPLVVRVTLSAASLPTPRRVSFVARTENDNGPGAESAPSNTISVGRPGAPAATATGSASGVEVTFTPATLLTGDTFRVWAVDASPGGSGETRLVEREVTTVTTAQGGQRTFFVPFADFEGNNIPYIVTLKMVAVNANNQRSQDGSASTSVTVGRVIAPTAVTATPALSGGTATVKLEWQRGDTTVTQYDIKATSASGAVMTFAISDGTKLGHILTVGGGVGQLPPGRWTFTVVAYNTVSQAESNPTGEVAAGTPGVPAITGVTGTIDGTATISFAIAADNVADRVRVSYAAVGSNTWTPLGAEAIPSNNEITTAALPTGNWRFRLESGNAGTDAWSAASSAWPATTVGLPGKPTIISATGSKDTITLVVKQAADATATSFELEVFDASGTAAAYNAPLQSVTGRDSNGRQTVVFGTDKTKLGGTYRFKVAAINSLGKGTTASEMTTQAQAVAAYMPDKPTGLTATGSGDKAVLAFTPPAGAVSYEAAILVATGDTWAVTAASSLAPYAPTAVTVSGTQRQFEVPLSALANLDGRYLFQVRAVDANGVHGEWSTESGPVTVGVPDAPRNLVSTAVLDTAMADSANSNVTLSFVPAWLAEQGYVVEVLDADGNKLDEVELAATTCTAKATAPV